MDTFSDEDYWVADCNSLNDALAEARRHTVMAIRSASDPSIADRYGVWDDGGRYRGGRISTEEWWRLKRELGGVGR